MDSSIITLENVNKNYGAVKALDDLSLNFTKGINGFLGPNGAGKTTTLKILIGLIKPDRGKVSVLGLNPTTDTLKVREKVGFFPEFDVLNIDVSANKFIIHMGMISGLSREVAVKQLNRIATFLDLGEEIHRNLTTLSQGMKQKVKLAIALISDPEILLLDEPTSGLDPIARERMLRLIEALHRELDKDIVLSTHILKDVEMICDNIVLINKGRVIYEGEKDRLIKPIKNKLLLKVSLKPNKRVKEFSNALNEVGLKNSYDEDENVIHVYLPDDKNEEEVINDILKLVREFGLELRTLKHSQLTLEEVFENIIRGEVK